MIKTTLLNNLGNLKKSLYKTDEAAKILKKILSIQPNAITVIYNLALLYSQMGKFEESKIIKKMLTIKSETIMIDDLTNHKI